jgi:translation initiation factor IF-2
MAEAGKKELPVILKADVQGSVETIRASLAKMSTDEVNVVLKHAAVGGITASDVTLAEASGAIIIGFNATASGKVRKEADRAGVDIRDYDVIYEITEDIEKAILGLLDPEHRIEVLGHAEVREVFRVSKVGMVAGCYVTNGVIERNSLIRVTRDDIVVENERRLSQLKRFKDDAKEVKSGLECGMLIDGYDDIHVGDVIECYRSQEVRPGS